MPRLCHMAAQLMQKRQAANVWQRRRSAHQGQHSAVAAHRDMGRSLLTSTIVLPLCGVVVVTCRTASSG